MKYLEIMRDYITAFEYWPQIAIFAGGALFGYLLRIIVFKIRIRRSRIKHDGRNIVLIEQKQRMDKIRKSGNADYFKCIKLAQYSPAGWNKNKNKGLGVSVIEGD